MSRLTTPVKSEQMRRVEDEWGEDLERLLPRLLRETGTIYGAARRLGVTEGSLIRWMGRLDLRYPRLIGRRKRRETDAD